MATAALLLTPTWSFAQTVILAPSLVEEATGKETVDNELPAPETAAPEVPESDTSQVESIPFSEEAETGTLRVESIPASDTLFAPPPLPGQESSADEEPPIARLRPKKWQRNKQTPAARPDFSPANLHHQPYELPEPQGELPAPHGELPPPQDAVPPPQEAVPPPPAYDKHGYEQIDPLPPLEEELWLHGGSYLYSPEGDRLNWPHDDPHAHYQLLRIPEDWHAPQPVTLFDDFLGAGPIPHRPNLRWPHDGYHWDPRLVLYGSYEIIGTALEENDQRHDLLGHQMFLDLDFRVTGTERAHVQWRPIGERNTGGSFYRFNDPEGYIDNSTGIPERYWIEFEVASVFGGYFKDEFTPRDYHVVVGKYPFALHNQLLINDDILGFVVNKNNIYLGTLSNLNVQAVVALDDVEAFTDGSANLYLLNATADHLHSFYEMTYGYVQHGRESGRDAQYAALSATRLCGPHTMAARGLFRWAPNASGGSGELYVLEYNRPWLHDRNLFGVEKSALYATAFHSTEGWQSISAGNFDRVRTAFAVDPLIPLTAARSPDDNVGMAVGMQFFRHQENESLLPELAYDAPGGDSVWGVGLRYQRKTGPRSFFEMQGVANWSDNVAFRREGVFLSETILF